MPEPQAIRRPKCAQAHPPNQFVFDDGGRAAAGFKGDANDCTVRAIAIATGKPYREVYIELAAIMRHETKHNCGGWVARWGGPSMRTKKRTVRVRNRKPTRFTQAEVARAVRGAKNAELPIAKVRIEPNGTIVIIHGEPQAAEEVAAIRKLAASKLTEAGCTEKQIAAIGGWRTLRMVGDYTKEADQKKLAKAAISKLEKNV